MVEKEHEPESKFQLIIRDLKERILSGELQPGTRIPTRIELENRYQASSRTVQKSLTVLIDEGFIFTRGRKGGSFVSSSPPCHSRIALLFPSSEDSRKRNVFYMSLHQEASTFKSDRNIAFEFFHGFTNLNNLNRFIELTDDLLAHRYAGVIFAGPPFALSETTLVTHPDICRAGVIQKTHFPHIPKVAHGGNFLERAMAHLASLGCCKPALISFHMRGLDHTLRQLCERFGMEYDLKRIHIASRDYVECVAHLMQTLMALPKTFRPDCIILCDDYLEKDAVAGLVAAGVTPQSNLPIVALCNYPMVKERELNVIHLGYDTRNCLQLLVQRIFEQHDGKTVPSFTPLPVMFEDEYKASLAD